MDNTTFKHWSNLADKRNTEVSDDEVKLVTIVVTTPKTEEEYKASDEYFALEEIFFNNTVNTFNKGITPLVEIEIVSENTEGLPKVYNKFLTEAYRGQYVCFIHDDVTIRDNMFYDKLIEAHEKDDVVGLAGATRISIPFEFDRPTAWHILSRAIDKNNNTVRFQSGFVTHEKDGKQWSTSFGHVPQQVKMLDGVFMSFDITACLDKGFVFDERFKFHHYDLSASIRALECGMTLTTCGIFVIHKGMGEMDSSWDESHQKFVEAYRHFGK